MWNVHRKQADSTSWYSPTLVRFIKAFMIIINMSLYCDSTNNTVWYFNCEFTWLITQSLVSYVYVCVTPFLTQIILMKRLSTRLSNGTTVWLASNFRRIKNVKQYVRTYFADFFQVSKLKKNFFNWNKVLEVFYDLLLI